MTLTASAPGKVIVFGEYAVIRGAPALVAAVDRRAEVTLDEAVAAPDREPRSVDITVRAPDLGIEAVCHRAVSGRLRWSAERHAIRRLHLVQECLAATLAEADQPGRPVIPDATDPLSAAAGLAATLSTTAFFDDHRHKFGLGSSAALTVALVGALRARLRLAPPRLPALVALHRTLQGGRGSGVDIAAATVGGTLVYTGADTDAPTARRVPLPPNLTWCCVFSGRSASTPKFLSRLADWRTQHPAGYAARLGELTGLAAAGAAAVDSADGAALLAAIDAYADGLDALGRDAGIDIMSTTHRELRNAATRLGVLYKPSGAGGGDIGLAFAADPERLHGFRRAATALGYRMIDLSVDGDGLTVTGDPHA